MCHSLHFPGNQKDSKLKRQETTKTRSDHWEKHSKQQNHCQYKTGKQRNSKFKLPKYFHRSWSEKTINSSQLNRIQHKTQEFYFYFFKERKGKNKGKNHFFLSSFLPITKQRVKTKTMETPWGSKSGIHQSSFRRWRRRRFGVSRKTSSPMTSSMPLHRTRSSLLVATFFAIAKRRRFAWSNTMILEGGRRESVWLSGTTFPTLSLSPAKGKLCPKHLYLITKIIWFLRFFVFVFD